VLKLILSLLLGGPVIALWPWRLPGWTRKTGTCLALAPVVVACIFLAVALVTRPTQFWVAGPILIALGIAAVAGACAFWPNTRPRRVRAVATMLYVGPLLALCLLGGAVWLGRGGTVFGKVTYRGQPVPTGKVSILSEDGVVCSGDIRADGRYIVYRVPPGAAKFAVAVYPAAAPGPVLVSAPRPVPVPRRYRDFDTSGLILSVTRGGQLFHIELRP
jgi:hypothetical protein